MLAASLAVQKLIPDGCHRRRNQLTSCEMAREVDVKLKVTGLSVDVRTSLGRLPRKGVQFQHKIFRPLMISSPPGFPRRHQIQASIMSSFYSDHILLQVVNHQRYNNFTSCRRVSRHLIAIEIQHWYAQQLGNWQ
mmetsp:Transcript_2110/g.5026  ORF Transcript_2110/g.5026 Transcript_2110/m.5026 type:complete len:135 (-) Transcript_2110:142-546(-)